MRQHRHLVSVARPAGFVSHHLHRKDGYSRELLTDNKGNDPMNVDEGRLNQLVGQMLNDLGGAASVAMVRMGDALGLYKTLHEKGGMTCDELAAAANRTSALSA